MVLQVRGTSIIQQQDRVTQLVAGHWSMSNGAWPYTVLSPSPGERLVLWIPADRLDDSIDLAEATVRSFSGSSGLSRVAFGAASSLVEELTTISNGRAEELAENVCGLMNLAIHERLAQPSSARPSLADRIQAYVVDNLRDPDLSLDTIARHLNASKRSLHRAVSDRNGSIHDLIWRERLERCRQDLLDPAREHHSIADIAHSWGFKNLTHFSRAFRTKYGLSAREARRIARQQACTA
jgi:AraC-like DNA-binding protein